jgi:Fic family protein
LGLDVGGLKPADRRTEGTVEMMLDATRGYDQPLTRERLFGWHAALFAAGHSALHPITVGEWRHASAGAMQVVSGPLGNEHVHFEAPAAERVEGEMRAFLQWFESPSHLDPVLKAALANFWFVTIHPFEDGNGRMARALTDMALARAEGSAQRFYSLSSQICCERRDYYDLLEQSQKASLDITRWLLWFLDCFGRAVDNADETLAGVLARARFWQQAQGVSLNDRQRLILNRMLDGWKGKLTSSKYAQLAHCSHDTALRDLTALTQRGLLRRGPAGGRSTAYELT